MINRNFPSNWSDLEVNLAHDWLTGMRGGERVLEILCSGFPSAAVYTLFYSPGSVSETIRRHRVVTSPLQRLPGIFSLYRYLLPLFPSAVRSLKPGKCDLVISTSHCVAKGVGKPRGTPHLCYCFTPMRYAWLFQKEYFGGSPLVGTLARPILGALRRWDGKTAANVDRFAAISENVKKRIARYYGRESDVVYPPVDVEYWTPGEEKHGDYDLIVSALVPYKRIDLAVKAYSGTGRRLKIAGTGTEYGALRSAAGAETEFLGRVSDEELLELYRSCRLLVFPGEEDFGLVPLEAQACGKPVVAFGKGGALETVKEGMSGVFFREQNGDAIMDAVERCAGINWDREVIRRNAERFSVQAFICGIGGSICATLEAAGEGRKTALDNNAYSP
ncbi:MAG: glycosyltransferase [Kiritimatiellia bacterium]